MDNKRGRKYITFQFAFLHLSCEDQDRLRTVRTNVASVILRGFGRFNPRLLAGNQFYLVPMKVQSKKTR